jgi:hypothetical protein
MSLHQNNELLLVYDKHHSVSHWPLQYEICILLITNCLELGVVAARGHKLASRERAVNMPSPCCRDPAMAFRGCFQKGIFVAWQGNGMACVNQTWPHYVNQMLKIQSKALAERHGRGMAWEQHGNGMVCVNRPL